MSEPSQLLGRVEKAIGPPATTLFAEGGKSRHFIFELTLTGVALYVLGKYLDGFIEGLGVTDLGKQHGKALKQAIDRGLDTYSGKATPDKHEVEQLTQSINLVIVALQDHRTNLRALESGSTKLLEALEEPGIPRSEAERITKDVASAVWYA